MRACVSACVRAWVGGVGWVGGWAGGWGGWVGRASPGVRASVSARPGARIFRQRQRMFTNHFKSYEL